MRRLLALPAAIVVLLTVVAPAALAAPEKWTWDESYSLAPEEFCGFAVDVHDYGRVSVPRFIDQWDLSQQWQGTRDYVAGDRTATMTWSWMLISRIESQTDTTMTVLLTNHGTNRIVAANGAVVTADSGRIVYRRSFVIVDDQWVQQLPSDEVVGFNGPHTLDFGNNFCDVMSGLLNPD